MCGESLSKRRRGICWTTIRSRPLRGDDRSTGFLRKGQEISDTYLTSCLIDEYCQYAMFVVVGVVADSSPCPEP